jgi:hypothetical protein
LLLLLQLLLLLHTQQEGVAGGRVEQAGVAGAVDAALIQVMVGVVMMLAPVMASFTRAWHAKALQHGCKAMLTAFAACPLRTAHSTGEQALSGSPQL